MSAPVTEVLVLAGGTELARRVLGPAAYTFGRSSSCDVQVDADQVSRQHARITVGEDGSLVLEDLGSSNGTFLDGQVIIAPTPVAPNQTIEIGAATLLIQQRFAGNGGSTLDDGIPPELQQPARYESGRELARGGMGAVLAVREAATRRVVAMKVMLDDTRPRARMRFIEEAQVTAQLEHPNIVPVHELAIDERGQPYYTMKLVQGITLKKILDLLAEGVAETIEKYPLGTLLTIFQKVCDALAFAHSKGVIHRDLKPANLMIGKYGEVLVMDWGLAKVVRSREGSPSLPSERPDPSVVIESARQDHGGAFSTMDGAIMGTPHYMSPEQARGEVESLDARSDIYALGAILYHILALRSPVEGQNLAEIVDRVGRGEIVPVDRAVLPVDRVVPNAMGKSNAPKAPNIGIALRTTRSTVPASLAAVVRKAMSLDPAARYPGVADLQADLTAYQSGFATGAEGAGGWKLFQLFLARHKAASISIAAGFALLVAVSTGFTLRVIGERNRAEEALGNLQRTAPTFHAQAKALVEEGKFDEALAKIAYAIQLDSANPDYHLFRANLRQATQHLAEAAEEYRQVLTLRPEDEVAKTNLALCERLLGENAGAPTLQRKLQLELLKSLRDQNRLVEAGPLNALVEPDISTAEVALRARLREFKKQPGWKDDRVSRQPDGTFSVDLKGLSASDVAMLRDQPISVLNLQDTGITDIKDLVQLRLIDLTLSMCKVIDLSPLKGMPLEQLNVGDTPISDLTPLVGMKLRSLTISKTLVVDLSSISGMPLRFLNVCDTKISDLTPLANCRELQTLMMNRCAVRDIGALASCSSLKELHIENTAIHDLSPLSMLQLRACHALSF